MKAIGKGETEWVFVDIKTGMRRSMPEEVVRLYTVVEE